MSGWAWCAHLQRGCCSSIAGGFAGFAYCERSFDFLIQVVSFLFLSILGCIWETFHLRSIKRHLGPIARYFTLGQKCHEDKHLNPLFQALGCKNRLTFTHYIYYMSCVQYSQPRAQLC